MQPDIPIKVIGKVGLVFDAFLRRGPELHLQEIAAASGLDLSTASRIVNSLVGIGLLRFDQVQRIYAPGLMLLELSRTVLNRFSFRELTHREMLALSTLSGWQCNLAILDERDRESIIYIDVTSTTSDPVERSSIGQRRPAHTTASGLVLLAHREEEAERTGGTLPAGIDEEKWRLRLEEVRSRGVAVRSPDEGRGFWAIAAPLFGPGGAVVAALGTGTESAEDFAAREKAITAELVAMARGISSAMRLSGGTSVGL